MEVMTYVASETFDQLLGIRYPDEEPISRTSDEVRRLIQEGHLVQFRRGNMSMDLDMDKFNQYVLPLYTVTIPENEGTVEPRKFTEETENKSVFSEVGINLGNV